MAGKIPNKFNDGKRKNNDRNNHNSNGGRSSTRQGNTRHGGRGRGRGGRGGRGNNSEHLKKVECLNCGRKGHYSTDCSLPRKNDNEHSNMVSKADFKNLFQSSLKEMLTKKDKQGKKNAAGDDDSLDMNVFEKLMEGKQPMFVTKRNDDLTATSRARVPKSPPRNEKIAKREKVEKGQVGLTSSGPGVSRPKNHPDLDSDFSGYHRMQYVRLMPSQS
jgi:hypothetical protein